ncbi:MAG: hypothetical protein ACD_42C00229G0003, partial [uncultured bacterium]
KILQFGFSQVVADSYAFKMFLFLPLFLNRLHNDPEHAAANGLILSTLNLLFIPAIAPLFGISPDVSGCFGELRATEDDTKKEVLRNKIRSTFQNGCLYALLVATPAVTLPLIFSEKIFTMLNQESQVSTISSYFLTRYANTIAPGFFCFFAGQFFIASGKTNILLAGSFVLGSTLLLSAGLSFGLGGLPRCDENGVLIAYSIESWLTAALYATVLFFHPELS